MAVQEGNHGIKRRVLLLYRTFGPSVNLCGFLQFQHLAETGAIEFRHKRIMQVGKPDINWADIVAFVRGDALLDEWMARISHEAGKYVVYILDDDLLNVPDYLGSSPYYAQRSVQRHIRRMMEYSDCFISPSERLIARYGKNFACTFRLIEPAAFCLKEKQSTPDGKVHIGFAGSSDRGSDIDLILTDALKEIMRRYGDKVSLEFFGVRTKLAGELTCVSYPYTESYAEYQEQMEKLNWDIGLAPMPETAFHACKHYNKLVEYCGFGIAGVYSDVEPYAGAVEDGVTGLLCENRTEAWVEALSRLIEDEQLRKSISQNCLERARGIFSVSSASRHMQEALECMEIPGVSRPAKGNFCWGKARGLCSWYLEKFKKYGVKTPMVAARKLLQQFKKEAG